MILWKKRVVLQGGGIVEITLEGEIGDPVEFWCGEDGKLICDLNRMVRNFENLSPPPHGGETEKKLNRYR